MKLATCGKRLGRILADEVPWPQAASRGRYGKASTQVRTLTGKREQQEGTMIPPDAAIGEKGFPPPPEWPLSLGTGITLTQCHLTGRRTTECYLPECSRQEKGKGQVQVWPCPSPSLQPASPAGQRSPIHTGRLGLVLCHRREEET